MANRVQRVRLRQDVDATFIAGCARGIGRLYDVSSQGFFVYSPTLLRAGSRVSAVFRTTAGGLSVAEGEVRWNTADVAKPFITSGFGVRVTRSDDRYRRLVQTAISTNGFTSSGAAD